MLKIRIRHLAAAGLFIFIFIFIAAAASATDLQILCREGSHVRLDGGDAGVCRETEEGRYLRDLAPGKHVIEVRPSRGGEWRRYEVELDEVAPGRLDARDADSPAKAAAG